MNLFKGKIEGLRNESNSIVSIFTKTINGLKDVNLRVSDERNKRLEQINILKAEKMKN